MELNLTQRIVLKYYRTKIQTLQKFSEQKAAEYILQLFFTPYITYRKAERPALYHKAEPLELTYDGLLLKGFRWNSVNPDAKTILVCHGMNSCSYRLEPVIQRLLAEHFTVVAFDAPAHGKSEGNRLNALIYSEVILELEKKFGPFYGIVAHSVAGMGTCFAMEQIDAGDKKIVLIAPAVESSTAMDRFFEQLKLSGKYRQLVESNIVQTRGRELSWYSSIRAIQHCKSQVLWIHDTDDVLCDYADTEPLRKMNLPFLKFVTTSGLGHNKIYRDKDVQDMVLAFLK